MQPVKLARGKAEGRFAEYTLVSCTTGIEISNRRLMPRSARAAAHTRQPPCQHQRMAKPYPAAISRLVIRTRPGAGINEHRMAFDREPFLNLISVNQVFE